MEWLIAGGVGSAFDVFSYNRKNFMFDGKMQLEREYQGQSMKIAQFGLYRDDIRDLVELSVSKMDIYLVINTIQLMMAVILFTEGKPKPDLGWPLRTIWLYTLCNIGAILYFLLSAWLAMHASIVAHSFGVRMLTQFARLPVPTTAELDAARAQALDYESKGAGDLLRIPVVQANTGRDAQVQINRLATELESDVVPGSESLRNIAAERMPQEENEITSLEHVKIYRELQSNWIGYDAYARVCMMMGANQFCHALGYYCLGVFIIENRQPLVGLGVALALLAATWLIVKLDIYVSSKQLIVAGVIFLLAPMLEVVSLTITISNHSKDIETLAHIMMPIIFFIHIVWIAWIIRIAWAEDVNGVALPKAFRSVTYLDVYGWTTAAPPETPSSRVSPVLSPRADPADAPSFVLETVSEAADEGDEELPHYQEAVERELGHLRFGQVRPTLGNPTEIRLALLGECQKFSERLSYDIGRWENEVVMGMLGAEARSQVSAARTRFNTVKSSFTGLEVQPREGEGSASREEYSEKVWLHVGSICYYCPDTGQSDFECPQEADRVSDIGKLEEEINEWAKHVRALRDSPSEPADSFSRNQVLSRHHSDVSSLSNTSHLIVRSRTIDGRRDTADEISSTSSHTSVTAAIRQFEPHQEGSISNRSRFAGLESVQLANQGALRDQFMDSCTFMVAQPHVHPNRRIRASATGQPRRPPGQVPFRTFCQGSIVLLLVWTIGLVWNTFDAFNLVIPLNPNSTHNGTDPNGTLLFDAAFAGPWPHPFFRSTGLACHNDAGSRVLLAERYAVHELDLRSNSIKLRPALVECLAANPEFQSAGIDDISMQCDLRDDGNSGCYALLLSVGYSAVLRCPFNNASGGTILLLPRLYSWLALTSGLHSNSFWGLTSKGIVELDLRNNVHDNIQELVPLSIAGLDPDARKLHILSGTDKANSSLLAMDDSGSVRVWPLHSGESLPITLSQDRLQDTRWVGLCSTVDEVFTISESLNGHRTNFWRRSLEGLMSAE